MAKKLKICMVISQQNGVGLYRIHHPANALARTGLAEVKQIPFYFDKPKDHEAKELFDMMAWSDVIIMQFRAHYDWIQMQRVAMDHQKPVLVELDDFILHVPAYNPGFRFYNPNNQEWEKWATFALHPLNCFGMIVTTPGLKQLYSHIVPAKNIFVCPNSLDMGYWDFGPKEAKHDKIWIGFQGSNAHGGNIDLYKDDLVKILEKYPQAEYHHVGHPMGMTWIDELVKKKRAVIHPWVKLEKHPKNLHDLGFDIGLAPLVDNLFNRGKSNLRLLEYGINAIPTIASPTSHYAITFKDNDNVLFAKGGRETGEWYRQMERLILDKDLRDKIGSNAREHVLKNFNLDTNAVIWYNACVETLNRFKPKPIPLYPPEQAVLSAKNN